MHPSERHLKLEKDGKKKEFIYYPGRNENSFEVVDMEVANKVYVFSFDIEDGTFSYSGGDLEELSDFIGRHILVTEF
ncbi:hypothetical protein [Sphingobacterium deserti]|uniref:Uncharacterized protein n=1 Tax=Sphingobacterium deserti TaxID=1229276 RepID=A0A0B8T4V8_9SPHI|nr:hypothetical protein [Sphingobacterium deserti]KGE12319.1 hypothetical protein DI53_3969 [Sphingobacterium deserti]